MLIRWIFFSGDKYCIFVWYKSKNLFLAEQSPKGKERRSQAGPKQSQNIKVKVCHDIYLFSCKVEWSWMIKLSLFWEFPALKLCATRSKVGQQVVCKSSVRWFCSNPTPKILWAEFLSFFFSVTLPAHWNKKRYQGQSNYGNLHPIIWKHKMGGKGKQMRPICLCIC